MRGEAINVTGVGKKYLIGRNKEVSLRDSLSSLFKKKTTPKDEFWALQDLNFTVLEGDIIGVIGKNGAGKSTLLKILSQITKPTTGVIEINGRVASLLEVGTGFHPELTGRENIYLNGTILGMQRKEVKEKFDEIVKFSGIGKFIDTPVKHYSSGMYVRLAFAVAAHLEPEILIIDEVLAVGDAEFQKKCLGKMQDVANSGRTVIFVSHNLSIVEKLCSKGIFLNAGKIELIGDIKEVTSAYLNSNKLGVNSWKRDVKPSNVAWFNYIKAYQHNSQEISTAGVLNIEFEYELESNIDSLLLHVALLDIYEQVIFSSAPEDSNLQKPLTKGKHKVIVKLPKDILISNNYILKLILWNQIAGVFVHYDVNEEIKFLPIETDSLINNTPGGRSGIIAVNCDWEIIE